MSGDGRCTLAQTRRFRAGRAGRLGSRAVRVYVSADMEGVAGVVDWDQCRVGAPAHAEGARLLLGEVNAAIEGALEAGADHVTVNDSHGLMANLPPDGLAGHASYLSGRHKPDYMMAGLNGTYDAVLYVGY